MGEKGVRPDQVRVNFHVDRTLNQRIEVKVPWGMKAHLMRAIMVMVADALDKHGDVVLGAILAGNMELKLKKKETK